MITQSLCIIPARGGSKRIPRKNIRDFLGKPIISYSIEAALSSGLFEEVMVSTDDSEIADIAKYYGATVPFLRSSSAASDTATTADVLLEVLTKYLDLGSSFNYCCSLYPTAPFVTKNLLIKAYNTFIENNYDSLLPVVKFSFPPQRGLLIDTNSRLRYKCPEFALARSQDLEPVYHDAGQFCWLKISEFLEAKMMLGSNTGYIELPELLVQDVDSDSDWGIAEFKWKYLNS